MAPRNRPTKTHEDYHVAVFCALEIEMTAFRYMLDNEHGRLRPKSGDSNMYVLGDLHGHNIVLVCLPGTQGKGAAATMATDLARSFPSIKWRLLVGIGGGIPSDKHDIRLGDVVVSMPEGTHGGVVQYDLGKEIEDGFTLKGFLAAPQSILRGAVNIMKSDHRGEDNMVTEFINEMIAKNRRLACYARPSIKSLVSDSAKGLDIITTSSTNLLDGEVCIRRQIEDPRESDIHYGLIASGDRVIKDAAKRDELVNALGDVLCFEMEAAGLMTEYSCIVIRGISDFADCHKNDDWHNYAAAAAAACAKELLTYVDVEEAAASDDQPYLPPPPKSQSTNIFHGNGIQNAGSGNVSIGGDMRFG